MLSRGVSGIRKQSLIINLPGSKKGSMESLMIVLPALKHAIDLIKDSKESIKKEHDNIKSNSEVHHQCSHGNSVEEKSKYIT